MPTANNANARARIACALSTLTVDTSARTIAGGLQLLAAGREAKGHRVWIDDQTVTLAADLIKAKGGRLKAYVTHDHAGPATMYWESDGSELDVCGFFADLSVNKGQLVAGRYEFYESFAKDDAPRFGRIMEMAAKTPDLLGLSVELWYYRSYVAEDGREFGERPEGVTLKYGGMPAMRPVDVFAAAFVSDGAATDGLFAKLSRKGRSALDRLLAALSAEGDDGAGEKPAAPAGSPANTPENADDKNAQHTGGSDEHPQTTSATMKIIQDIKGRFGANEGRLSAAMTILGKASDPASLTIDSVALQVVEGELSALNAALSAANQKAADAEKARAALATENETLKQENATLKNSGYHGVNLGAGSAGGGGAPASGPNPWAKDSINFTQQAAILKADPARAKALALAVGAADPTLAR